jgi:pyrroloquinoline-quinone synthase
VLSSVHAQLEDADQRRVVLENLIDEERGDDNHAELWLRFAEAVGVSRDEVREAAPLAATQALVDSYLTAGASSPADGLAALYAYEHQVPAVADAKLAGLAERYGVTEGTEFWRVHGWLDTEHAGAERSLLREHAGESAIAAARAALDAWWDFLTEVEASAGTSEGPPDV